MKLKFDTQSVISYLALAIASGPQVLRFLSIAVPVTAPYALPLAVVLEKIASIDQPIDPIPAQFALGLAGAVGLHATDNNR